MKLPPARPILTVLVLALLFGRGGEASGTSAGPTATYKLYLPGMYCGHVGCSLRRTPAEEVQRAIDLINQARSAAGCPAALEHESLMRGAQGWSEYMAATGDYTHAPAGWYQRYGYQDGNVENIGVAVDAEYIVNGWLSSPYHRRNILLCRYSQPGVPDPNVSYEIGIGLADGYWTMALGVHDTNR